MKSMTGYGKGTASAGGITISVELKSVNHRFLDVSMKMPKVLGFLDDVVRKTLAAQFSRGHIDVYINLADLSDKRSVVNVDLALAKKYVEASNAIAAEFGYQNDFSVEKIMRTADVITITAEEADEATIAAVAKDALSGAVKALQAMRAKEGKALAKDFLKKNLEIAEILKKVEAKSDFVRKTLRDKIEARVKDVLSETPVDETKLLNEVAFYADRFAIDEEITRLKAHIKHAEDLISEKDAVGRKFDFLIQEFNREVNTIGSKCSDTEITAEVLNMKNIIEKMREQIQNIE